MGPILIDKLSDFQLYALVINLGLYADLLQQANSESLKRDFSQAYIDEMSLKFGKLSSVTEVKSKDFNKYWLIALPFYLLIQPLIPGQYMTIGLLLSALLLSLWYRSLKKIRK